MNWDLASQGILLVASVIGIYLNNKKKSINFLIFMFCYAAWTVIYWYHGVYGACVKEIIFIGFNIHGWILWHRDDVKARGEHNEKER